MSHDCVHVVHCRLSSLLWLYFHFGTAFCFHGSFSLPSFLLVLVAFSTSVFFQLLHPVTLLSPLFPPCICLPDTCSLLLLSILDGFSAFSSVDTQGSVVSWIPSLPLSPLTPLFYCSASSSHLSRKSMRQNCGSHTGEKPYQCKNYLKLCPHHFNLTLNGRPVP